MKLTSKPLFILLLLLGIAVLHVDEIQAAVALNRGWLHINQGMVKQDSVQIAEGQRLITQALDEPCRGRSYYCDLAEAKLDASNLMINGGFDFSVQGWVINGELGVWPVLDQTVSYTSRNSLKLEFNGSDINYYHTFQEVEVEPNTCYLLTLFIRTEELTGEVSVDIWDAERGFAHWYGGQATAVGNGTHNWTPSTLEFCTESDIEKIQIRLRRFGGSGEAISGRAWFDDVTLTKKS